MSGQTYIYYQPHHTGQTVGSVNLCYTDTEGWLWSLEIRESFRGLGHSHGLMKCIIEKCRELRLPSIKLSCYADNTIALNLYLKHGFSITNTYPDKWDEELTHDLQLTINYQDETRNKTECATCTN